MRTTANQKLRLKKPNGWFPAGDGFLEAITVLSDGAFKLFVFLCLNADRRTATYSASARELGRVVGKSHRWVQTYITELQVKGLCSSLPTRIPYLGTTFRICDQYWPYASDAADADTTPNEYVTAIRNTFLSLGCTTARFGPPEQRQTLEFQKRGVPLEVLTDAMFIAACRKFVAWLNNGQSQPIGSMRYFENVVEEVQERPFPPEYRDHIRFEVRKLTRLWAESPKRIAAEADDREFHKQRRDDADAILGSGVEEIALCDPEIEMRDKNR